MSEDSDRNELFMASGMKRKMDGEKVDVEKLVINKDLVINIAKIYIDLGYVKGKINGISKIDGGYLIGSHIDL